MTQLMILGGIVTGLAALYIYISNNKEHFVRKKEPPNDPFNVIYLPADLEAHKNTSESNESEDQEEPI